MANKVHLRVQLENRVVINHCIRGVCEWSSGSPAAPPAAGADVNVGNPLNVAIESRSTHRKEIVELLLAKGCDVNAKNNRGWTPVESLKRTAGAMMLVGATDEAKAANNEIAALLLQHGAKTGDEFKHFFPNAEQPTAVDANLSVELESDSPTAPADTVDDTPGQTADDPPAGDTALPLTPNNLQAQVDKSPLTAEQITEALDLRAGEWKYSDGQTLTGRWKEKGVAIEIKGQNLGRAYSATVVYDPKTGQFVGTSFSPDGEVLFEKYNRWDPETKTLTVWKQGLPDSDWTIAIQKTGPNSVSCDIRILLNGEVVARNKMTGERTPKSAQAKDDDTPAHAAAEQKSVAG